MDKIFVSKQAALVIMLIGAILATGALVVISKSKAEQERCCETVSAVVVEFKTIKRVRTTYAPVLEYSYNGKSYRWTSYVSTNPPRFEVGQKVSVKIDPDNPAEGYDASDGNKAAVMISLGAGIVLFLFGTIRIATNE